MSKVLLFVIGGVIGFVLADMTRPQPKPVNHVAPANGRHNVKPSVWVWTQTGAGGRE